MNDGMGNSVQIVPEAVVKYHVTDVKLTTALNCWHPWLVWLTTVMWRRPRVRKRM